MSVAATFFHQSFLVLAARALTQILGLRCLLVKPEEQAIIGIRRKGQFAFAPFPDFLQKLLNLSRSHQDQGIFRDISWRQDVISVCPSLLLRGVRVTGESGLEIYLQVPSLFPESSAIEKHLGNFVAFLTTEVLVRQAGDGSQGTKALFNGRRIRLFARLED